MKLALLSITGAAALSGVTTTTDWTAARSALRQRDVGAVVVEGAAAPADAWRGAMEGDACAAVDVSCEACDCAVAAVQSAFAPLWGAADEDGAAAAQIVDLARCYDRCLADKSDGGRVRVRATVTRGRATAPCPKLHTDFVALRGLVALEGPGTVVAPEVNLAVSNLMPAWMVARMDRDEGAATVSPARDAFLLVSHGHGLRRRRELHREARRGRVELPVVVDRHEDALLGRGGCHTIKPTAFRSGLLRASCCATCSSKVCNSFRA